MNKLWHIIKCFIPNSEERKLKEWYESLRESAIEWNITTLTENTITMQIRKVCEEVCEVLDAVTFEEAIKEKADVLISVWGLSAFDDELGMKAEKFFWETNTLPEKKILVAAESKLIELHTRTYEIKNGVYHHNKKLININ